MHRTIAALAALATALLTALALALPAAAAISPTVHYVANGSAGYSATEGNGFTNVGTDVIPLAAAVNIGGVGHGGIGIQLCDPNTGAGGQLGLVSNGHTFTVEYATGTLSGASAAHCEGNGVLANPHVLNADGTLSGIPVGDDVQLFIRFHNVRVRVCHHHHCHSVWQGRMKFEADDVTSGGDISSAYVHTAPIWNLTEAGAGIQQDTTGMSTCSSPLPDPDADVTSGVCNPVAHFFAAFINGTDLGFPGFGRGLAGAVGGAEIVTSAGGLHVNPALVAPLDTLTPPAGFAPSAFTVYAGAPTV